MKTDKLFEALKKKAINRELFKIEQATNTFKKTIEGQPNGSNFDFFRKDIMIGGIKITPDDFFTALKKSLINSRSELLVIDEIKNFMESHNNYTNQINEIQNYLINQG